MYTHCLDSVSSFAINMVEDVLSGQKGYLSPAMRYAAGSNTNVFLSGDNSYSHMKYEVSCL